MKRLGILTICTVVVSCLIFFFKKRNPTTIAVGEGLVIKQDWLETNNNPITAKKDIRPADQTFLTFPEWYLVFSPAEQATYFKNNTATSFPYMSHVKQFWESYGIMKKQIKGNFPPNNGYHLMIWVIGVSTTIEYSLKALYETTIGWLTNTSEVVTDEDKFYAKFTQDYVDFIKDRPWYEFDFKNQLKSFWANTSFLGDNFIRKTERKYLITSELLVKWAYGKLIGLGTKQVYDEALPTTSVITENGETINLPRYDKFNQAITTLAKQGKIFKEIAGNDSAILLTILVSTSNNQQFEDTQIVFTQPISSNLSMKRIALAIPVKNLNKLLIQLDKQNIKIEHIFDY
jgi:hypothetical protein